MPATHTQVTQTESSFHWQIPEMLSLPRYIKSGHISLQGEYQPTGQENRYIDNHNDVARQSEFCAVIERAHKVLISHHRIHCTHAYQKKNNSVNVVQDEIEQFELSLIYGIKIDQTILNPFAENFKFFKILPKNTQERDLGLFDHVCIVKKYIGIIK